MNVDWGDNSSSFAKCSRCGNSFYLYLKRSSGEILCRYCLEKLLVREVRRVLGRFQALRYGEDLLVVEPFIPDVWFSSAIALLYKSVRRHRNKLHIAVFDKYSLNHVERIIRGFDGVYLFDANRYIDRERILDLCLSIEDPLDSYICLKKADVLVGVYMARKISINTIAVLRPRDQAPIMVFLGTLLRDPSTLIEAHPMRTVGMGVRIINPIYGISLEDIASYSYLSGTYINDLEYVSGVKRVLDTVKSSLKGLLDTIYRSRELAFSIDRSLELIDRDLLSDLDSRCMICGSRIRVGEDLCERCKLFRTLLKDLPNPSG